MLEDNEYMIMGWTSNEWTNVRKWKVEQIPEYKFGQDKSWSFFKVLNIKQLIRIFRAVVKLDQDNKMWPFFQKNLGRDRVI